MTTMITKATITIMTMRSGSLQLPRSIVDKHLTTDLDDEEDNDDMEEEQATVATRGVDLSTCAEGNLEMDEASGRC